MREPRKLDPSLTFIKAVAKWEAENKAAEKSAAKSTPPGGAPEGTPPGGAHGETPPGKAPTKKKVK